MCRVTNFLPTHVHRILYNPLILPHHQYSIFAWGFIMGRLDKLQKRAKCNSHADPLFRKLNLLKAKDLFALNVLKFLTNVTKTLYLSTFQILFWFYRFAWLWSENHIHSKRCSNMSSRDKCIRYYLPVVIDNSKNDILNKIETHSLYGFAFYRKRKWLKEYKIECVEQNCYVCNRRS